MGCFSNTDIQSGEILRFRDHCDQFKVNSTSSSKHGVCYITVITR